MKLSEIAQGYGFDKTDFEDFIIKHTNIKAGGVLAVTIPDNDVHRAIALYKEKLNKEKEAIQKEKEKQEAVSKMLISSGFSFDGYHIAKYSGYISGDDAVQIPRSGVFGGDNGQNLTDALVKIRIQAIKELKEAAYELGCNADRKSVV